MSESERPPVNLSKDGDAKTPEASSEPPKLDIDRTAKAKRPQTRVPVNPINVIGGVAGLAAAIGLGVMGVNKAIEAITPGPDHGIEGPIVPGDEHEVDSSHGRFGAEDISGDAAFDILQNLDEETPIANKYEPMTGDNYAPVVYDREDGMIVLRSRAAIDGDPARIASKEIVFLVDPTSHFSTQEQVTLDDIQDALLNSNITDLTAISVNDGGEEQYGMYFGVNVYAAEGPSGADIARRVATGDVPEATDPGMQQLFDWADVKAAEKNLGYAEGQAGIAIRNADN